MKRSGWLFAVCALMACGDSADDRALDAGWAPDAASIDASVAFGSISGDCSVLDDELTSSQASVFRSAFDFPRIYMSSDAPLVEEGTVRLLNTVNAGGSSVFSEAFSFEVLGRCESAALIATETEISYDVDGKKTDFSTDIDSVRIGVSVTRAVNFPFDSPFTVSDAQTLLEGKLADILVSSANVSAGDAWQKQILAIMAYGPGHGDSLQTAVALVDSAVRADTIVWIIVTDGDDGFIYCDGPCQ